MGAKTVVKRQNHALLDRSKDILARHKRPENGFMHHIMTDDITWIYYSEQKIQVGVRTMGTRWYQAQEKFK